MCPARLSGSTIGPDIECYCTAVIYFACSKTQSRFKKNKNQWPVKTIPPTFQTTHPTLAQRTEKQKIHLCLYSLVSSGPDQHLLGKREEVLGWFLQPWLSTLKSEPCPEMQVSLGVYPNSPSFLPAALGRRQLPIAFARLLQEIKNDKNS